MARFDSITLRVLADIIEPTFEFTRSVTEVVQGNTWTQPFYYTGGQPKANSWESLAWSSGGQSVSGSRAPNLDLIFPSAPKSTRTARDGSEIPVGPNEQLDGYLQGNVTSTFPAGDYHGTFGIGDNPS